MNSKELVDKVHQAFKSGKADFGQVLEFIKNNDDEYTEPNPNSWSAHKLTGESEEGQYDKEKSIISKFTFEDPVEVIKRLIDLYNNHIASNKKFDYPTIKLTIEPSELAPKWNHFTLEVNKNE